MTTAEPCGAGIDPDKFKSGTKLDDINVNDASPFIQAGNVLNKADICAVRRAWELVPASGRRCQYHFISYLAWSRVTTNGEINVLIPLLGTDPSSQADDIIVNYDYVDNTAIDHAVVPEVERVDLGRQPAGGKLYNAFTATGVTDPGVPSPPGTT